MFMLRMLSIAFVCGAAAQADAVVTTTKYDELDPPGLGSLSGIAFEWEFTWNRQFGAFGSGIVSPTNPPGPDVENFWRSSVQFPRDADLDGVFGTIRFVAQHMKRPPGAEHVLDAAMGDVFIIAINPNLILPGVAGAVLFVGLEPHSPHRDFYQGTYNNPAPGAGDITFRFVGQHQSAEVPEPRTVGLFCVGFVLIASLSGRHPKKPPKWKVSSVAPRHVGLPKN